MVDKLDDQGLDLLFREARSFSHWQDRPLPEGTPEAIWALLRLGPTAANCQPARLHWCVSAEARTTLAGCVSEGNVAKVRTAPATVIIAYDPEFYERLPTLYPPADARAWFAGNAALIAHTALRDSSLQAAYLMLAARALGLDAGPMAGFDAEKVEQAFLAGTGYRATMLCAIGYGDRSRLHPRLPRLAFADANIVS
ncbi:malonic semialdehyde reductase [Sphingomonas morindae]|uniref:Malonic semialdehyde reductase n=1 Tax=Sphingomonas morindae TaxID=1541170 RepID=A0ABY4X6R7_9SPHN|nr:malonic semialdehyde reductase [Sphingomonas morindae]USI72613.1 malonic semialdehyde reductase [Sphingomonas morindae]